MSRALKSLKVNAPQQRGFQNYIEFKTISKIRVQNKNISKYYGLETIWEQPNLAEENNEGWHDVIRFCRVKNFLENCLE